MRHCGFETDEPPLPVTKTTCSILSYQEKGKVYITIIVNRDITAITDDKII